MFRARISPVGLFIAAIGVVVLAASLYGWTRTDPPNRLFYTEDERAWVSADSSSAPGIEGDEAWRISATCQRPYFVEAAERARAKLKAHADAIPDEVRAWRAKGPTNPDGGLALRTKYQDWFLAEARLEEQLQRWEHRLSTVGDRSITLGEARRRTMDIRIYVSDDIEAASAGRDFKHFVLFLLGLGGFPDEQTTAIEQTCIKVIPLKSIVTRTTYHTDAARWPADRAAAFWPGLMLVLIGLAMGTVPRRPRRGCR